jgi:hypothetical protein
VIRKKDHHTPSLWHFHRKVDDAVTQLCPVVTKHSHRVRPVRRSQNGVKTIVLTGVLDLVVFVDS